MALVLMLIAEFGFVVWIRGLTIRGYFSSRDPAGTVYYVMLAVFAAMPVVVARR